MWENLVSVLEGSVVRLEPLASRHEAGLFEAARFEEIWRWLPFGSGGGDHYPARDSAAFHGWFESALKRSYNCVIT